MVGREAQVNFINGFVGVFNSVEAGKAIGFVSLAVLAIAIFCGLCAYLDSVAGGRSNGE